MMSLRLTPAEYRAHQARVKAVNGHTVAAPQPSTAKQSTAPSSKGVGQGAVAASAFKGKLKAAKRDYARELAKQIKAAGLPKPELEYAFDAQLEGEGRGWRFDLCWPLWLAVEVDGSVHRIKGRFKADLAKHQAAFALGYKLLRVSPEQVRNGEALELVRRAFE